jgi:hypothetical protein
VALASNEKTAFAAWEHHAIDFLLKPYSPQRLAKTLAKLRIHLAGRVVLALVPPPLAALLVDALKVAGSRGPLLIKLVDISAIKAEGDYSRITKDHGASHLIRRTLVAWVKLLAGATFFQVDRFTLINLVHVVSSVGPRGITRSCRARAFRTTRHLALGSGICSAAAAVLCRLTEGQLPSSRGRTAPSGCSARSCPRLVQLNWRGCASFIAYLGHSSHSASFDRIGVVFVASLAFDLLFPTPALKILPGGGP